MMSEVLLVLIGCAILGGVVFGIRVLYALCNWPPTYTGDEDLDLELRYGRVVGAQDKQLKP